MTAAPAGPTDAQLVERVLAADREAFATVYDRYGPRLYDFAHSMLRHREDAADAVADSFVLFAERLPQLRDPDRLRPWLYAIVRSQCLHRLKGRKRIAFGEEEQLVEMADDAATPEQAAEKAALQQLVWDAAAGLADRDRALLDLHLRQGLEGAELGEAMGVTAANAYVMLNRLRGQVDRSLGALLIARTGRDDCPDLDALLADWDGSFSPLIRKRVARHVDGCGTCGERRRRMVSPWMLLAGVPMVAAPAALRDRVLNDTQLVAYAGPAATAEPAATTVGGHRWGSSRISAAAVAAVVLAIVATVLLWPDAEGETGTPVATEAPASTTPGTPAATLTGQPTTSPSPTTTPTTTPSPTASRSASVSEAPAALTISTRSLALGTSGSRATVRLGNSGDLPLTYRASSRASWLSVSPASGDLAGGSGAELVVRAQRGEVPEGRSSGSVVVTWAGGTETIRVSLTEERDPVVGAPGSPTGDCDVNRVSVSVSDESGLRSVRLSWSGPGGSGSRLMTGGATRTAEIGQVSPGGSYLLRVTATDNRGNVATSSRTVTINPCPG